MSIEDTNEKDFMNAKDVADLVGISKPSAYRVIHKLNEELSKKGFVTFSGKIPTKYLRKRIGI